MEIRYRIVVVVVTVTMAFACQQSLFAAAAEEQAAFEAAKTWLALVDSGEYDKSWDEAAFFFQGRCNKRSVGRISPRCQKAAWHRYIQADGFGELHDSVTGGSGR